MYKKFLHILSFDGLSKVDMEFLKNEPNFKSFLKEASGCYSVKSVYPSLTYCAHTSIVTGVNPSKHGIVSNTKIQPYTHNPDWYWFSKDIKVDSFQKKAYENGYSILSIFWPVTAGSKYIKYNMPEIFANRWWKHQIIESLRSGSKLYQIDMNKRFGHLRNGIKEPELDNYTHESFMYSLEHYKTDINMVHYIDLDSQRHDFGFHSEQAYDALRRLDKRLGDLIKRLKQLNMYEDSVIVILGDHSSIDGHTNIYLNTVLEEHGLLKKNDDETIGDYDVLAKDTDGSSYIYINKKKKSKYNVKNGEEILYNDIVKMLKPLIDKGIIEKIYKKNDVEMPDKNAALMIEASRGYFFKDEVKDEVLISVETLRKRGLKAHVNNHGYHPNLKEDYETVFFVSGKGIKKGKFIDEMSLIDEAYIFSKIMGFEMKDIDGKCIDDLFVEK